MKKVILIMIGVIGMLGALGALGAAEMAPVFAATECAKQECSGDAGFCAIDTTYYCDQISPTGYYRCDNGVWNYDPSATQQTCTSRYNNALWYNQTVKDFAKNVYEPAENEMGAERYAKYSLDNIASSLGIGLGGAPGQIASVKNSVIGQLGGAIAFMSSTRPVNTSQYLAYMKNKAGFPVEQAYAQGAGYRGLQPVMRIWAAFRNIAYLFTSLTLIVVGFMIMLRKKIDPQTVIGIQQALPKLIVTLLLITFSYAIAGFVVDMLYFLSYLVIRIFGTFKIFSDPDKAKAILMGNSSLAIGLKYLWWELDGAATNMANSVGKVIDALIGADMATGGLGSLLGQPIAYVVVTVAIFYAMFKLFWSLLMAYIQIILGTIIAPLQLMLGAIPGSDAFGKWIRNLLANAMAFPATTVMFLLGAALMGLEDGWGVAEGIGYSVYSSKGEGFSPPFLGANSGMVDIMQALIGMGIIFMTPKVVDMVKEFLQAPEFKYGSAIGEAVGFGWNTAKGAAGQGWSAVGGYDIEKELAARKLVNDAFVNGRIVSLADARKQVGLTTYTRANRALRLLGLGK